MSLRSGRDLARTLLDRAADDEALVRRVLDDADIADSIIGFHAQQAVEKSIKAVLAAHQIDFRRTHDLDYLASLVTDGNIDAPAALEIAQQLAPWAVEFRYETESEPALDRPATLRLIEEVRGWAIKSVDA